MKKRIVSRRLLAVLLALSMCLSLLPVTALAEEETETAPGAEEALEFNEAASSEEEPELSQPTEEALPEQIASDELDAAPSEIEPRSGETWEKVQWEDIQSGGTYIITMTVSASATTYILPSATNSKNPTATSIETSGDELMADADTYGWTFIVADGGYIISNGTSYLSPAYGSTNGVRVGNTQAVWALHSSGNYLSTPDISGSTKTWSLGVYTNSLDWRTYSSDPTSNNTKNQTLALWHLQGETIEEHTQVYTPTATPGTNSTFVAWGG